MTLNELYREIQELLEDGYGDCIVQLPSGNELESIDPNNSDDDLWIEVS